MATKIKRNLEKMIDRRAPDWIDFQLVRLGKDSTQLIATGRPGILWARLSNGKPIQVRTGSANVPSRFDLHLVVGRRRAQPNIWQVIYTLEDYDDPAGGGELTYHHEQHEEGGGDRVNLSRKQITARTVRVKNSAGFIVRVYGDADLTVNGWKQIPPFKDFNLFSLHTATTAGARFIAIESDNNGDLSLNAGNVFASPGVGTPTNYPVPATGKYPIARILLFEGQTALLDEHITISMPPSFNPADVSLVTHDHDTRYPRKWVGKTLAPTTDDDSADGYSVDDLWIDETNNKAYIALDVTVGNAVWQEIGSVSETGSSHVHGLARWNGASGQTTFELPDIWEYIDSLMLNGLEEDPLVYALSADGTQIVLDTALTSNTNVLAHGVIRSI